MEVKNFFHLEFFSQKREELWNWGFHKSIKRFKIYRFGKFYEVNAVCLKVMEGGRRCCPKITNWGLKLIFWKF